jgi:glutathione S-transferase
MQYLAAKKPEAGLLPRDEALRADVTRWQFWDASHFSPNVASIAFEKLIKPMMGLGETDAGKVADALVSFRRFAAVLDKRLEGRKFVVGDAMTIADLTLASTLMYSKQAELPLAEFPNIDAWFGRISALPAWSATNP